MTDTAIRHEVQVVHTPGDLACLFQAECSCGAEAEPIVVIHTSEDRAADPDACGRARRSLYQWEREHHE